MTHLIGKVLSVQSYDRISTLQLSVGRQSGVFDVIPVRARNSALIPNHDYTGQFVFVKGHFCSDNLDGHLILYVMADSLIPCEDYFYNGASFSGYICKRPTYRLTPKGREISDLLVAVEHGNHQSYIPCVCWEENSHLAAQLDVGERVHIVGRIQSRGYTKDGTDRIAYELSVDHIASAE